MSEPKKFWNRQTKRQLMITSVILIIWSFVVVRALSPGSFEYLPYLPGKYDLYAIRHYFHENFIQNGKSFRTKSDLEPYLSSKIKESPLWKGPKSVKFMKGEDGDWYLIYIVDVSRRRVLPYPATQQAQVVYVDNLTERRILATADQTR